MRALRTRIGYIMSYKTNMENDCAFANLEDKYTFKLDKMAIASSRWMCRTLPIQGRIARVSFRLHRMYTQLPILSIYVLDLFSIVILVCDYRPSVIHIERNLQSFCLLSINIAKLKKNKYEKIGADEVGNFK
jgi:hypothetical protein